MSALQPLSYQKSPLKGKKMSYLKRYHCQGEGRGGHELTRQWPGNSWEDSETVRRFVQGGRVEGHPSACDSTEITTN